MKIDIETVFKALALPIGLIALFSALLGLFGISLDTIILIAESLVGTFALISLLINVLKWAGAISDGDAGKWSAAGNLLVVVTVSVIFKLYPQFDFEGIDLKIVEFVRVAGVVLAYIIQIVGSKAVHAVMTRGLNVRAFSYTLCED